VSKKCQRGSGEVENRWKPSGNQTTTNRRSTKTSTTFCVFLLTEYFLPLILRIQIRGTWKRQTDRIGDEKGPCGLGHEAARVLSEKIEREYLLRARISGGAPAVRLSANHRPTAEHWRFALELECDRSMAGLFFRCPLSRTHRIERCVNFSPDPEAKRGASAGRRGVK